jgi:superoxide dismutase, Fe-Mn family
LIFYWLIVICWLYDFLLFLGGEMNKIFCGVLLALTSFFSAGNSKEPTYIARDFSYLLDMPGWSSALLEMHFSLYQGYVKNTNLLIEEIEDLNKMGGNRTFDYGAIKRCFSWEFDGMRLHELYFEAFTKDSNKGEIDESLAKQLKKDFGSVEAWKQDFIATGLIRGIGWVVLYKDPIIGKLYNVWVNEHDVGNLVLGEPLLILDVFEHAYITQFGLDRTGYIDLFFKSISWDMVNKRWSAANLESFANLKSHKDDNSKAK